MARPPSIDYVPVGHPLPAEVVDRVLVFDGVLSPTHLAVLERWALQTPHWMLNNAARDAEGRPRHRIWGASYIGAWQAHGWPGLPPVLFSAAGTVFQRLGFVFVAPRYIGLNGQSRGQDASTHVDCERDARDQLSVLIYVGEDTDGDLVLHDKDDPSRAVGHVAFRPNRVVAFDGSIPHAARAPGDDRFRMSVILRGAYVPQGTACANPWTALAAHWPVGRRRTGAPRPASQPA